ncbi:MAG: 3-oxoacyl-ACP synthase III family protein [Bacteroidales bacterium]
MSTNIYINAVGRHVPATCLSNDFFKTKSGLLPDEIVAKCGVIERRITQPHENTNTMAAEAVKDVIGKIDFDISEIDLIIGATYTPYDTVGSLAHSIQRKFRIHNAKCLNVDSACSSFINALEIAESFIESKKANKVLIIASENNSVFNDYDDPKSGFLWGDGAAAVVVSGKSSDNNELRLIDIDTKGLACVGKSIDAVTLRPARGGLRMPLGKDVFHYACLTMISETEQIMSKNHLPTTELKYFIPHQANKRIIEVVARKLKIQSDKVLLNIENLGNTGCASTPLLLAENWDKFEKNDNIVITVFGGGYSSGTVLLRKN